MSIIGLAIVSVVLGIVLSKNQPYSPLPSSDALLVASIWLGVFSCFVAYAVYRGDRAKQRGVAVVRALLNGALSFVAGFSLMYLVRTMPLV